MAWSKYGTTTNAWTSDVSTEDKSGTNATNGTNSGVLEELIAFMVTRGWVVQDFTETVQTNGSQYSWWISKNAVCEDSSTQRMDLRIDYIGDSSTSDGFRLYLASSSGAYGKLMESGATADWNGKWNFWISDGDSDSFLILVGDASNRLIGLHPPAGSLFSQGYYTSDWTTTAGILPLFQGSGPSWNALANGLNRQMRLPFSGDSSYSEGLSTVPEKFDFTFVTDFYERPLFRTVGGDVAMILNYGESSSLISTSTSSPDSTNVMQIGSQYYIVIGDYQKLLFNTGTVAPVF